MSGKATKWLESQHSGFKQNLKSTIKISIASGKGGVGKTSSALKIAKLMSNEGLKVLLVDCDYNLSNTAVKLGLPLNDNFYSLITSQISFDEAIYKQENFHLLSACNGNLDLFNSDSTHYGQYIIDVISAHENEYDVILLDCPAGLSKDVCVLSAYCDYRFVVVTPDKSSITDSYSLIKILQKNYSIQRHHLLFNKVLDKGQYNRLTKTFVDTVSEYLTCSVEILGGVGNYAESDFDRDLLKVADSKIHKQFSHIVEKFVEKNIATTGGLDIGMLNLSQSVGTEHEVRTY